MFKELKKYKKTSRVKTPIKLPDKQVITIIMDEYEFPVGDLISIYIKHVRKPWWKRDCHHEHLSEYLVRCLNNLTVIQYW